MTDRTTIYPGAFEEMRCIDSTIGRLLEDYVLNRLDRQMSRQFEDHLFECARCRWELLEEDLLKNLARKHRMELVSASEKANFPEELRRYFEMLTTLYPQPSFPIQFRRTTDPGMLINDLNLHTVNLSGMLTVYDRRLQPSVHGDQLLISGFIREMADREVYLLLNRKSDLLSLDVENTGQIRTIIEEIGYSFVISRRMDPAIRDVLGRAFVLKGVIRKIKASDDTANSSKSGFTYCAEMVLSPIGLSYLQNPDYMAILVVM